MSSQSINQCMRRRFVPYFIVQTLLWMLFLSVSDILPKEGELIPRGGTWREATQADRIMAFVWFTFCWYFGAITFFWLTWRVAQVVYNVAFGSERSE